jgi:predicted dehydrogenase
MKTSIGAAVGAATAAQARAAGANEKVVIGVIGFRGRGGGLLKGFLEIGQVEVGALCDVDRSVLEQGVKTVQDARGATPEAYGDYRQMMENKAIDAVVIGTPDHWHAIPAIAACQAGKHVYVEKPAAHNIHEGAMMLKAARKYDRVMQVGCQSRSGRHFAEAMDYIRSGALGVVSLARAWESTKRGSLGYPKDGEAPAGVDYDRWLGPAPKRAFNPARFHSNWRWFFDYGTGDLGNDGVHRIDYARRALGAAFEGRGKRLPDWPTACSAAGGKFILDDIEDWPDTQMVTWEYPGAVMVYEMRCVNAYPFEGEPEGAAVYGTEGYVVIGNRGWRAYDGAGKALEVGTASDNDQHDPAHKANFLDCIKTGQRANFDIAEGHISSALCHMGNTAWRTGHKVRFDPQTHRYVDDAEANALVSREYRSPYVLPEV